jgi:hypothetical protein
VIDVKIKDKLATIKSLVADIERHLEAGAVVKANSRAVDLEHEAKALFRLSYKIAFPDEPNLDCLHFSTTDVQGGGKTCNSCGRWV